jgi:hypothetical protein
VQSPTAAPTGTPTPAPRTDYITPGYGNAAQQSTRDKRDERAVACRHRSRPPTSHMLGLPGVVSSNAKKSYVPLLIAVAVGAAVFALAGATLRRRRPGTTPSASALEGFATLVAICGGLAGLAAQFIPAASIEERPPRAVKMTVRDVKPRITRGEYLQKLNGRALTAGELRESRLKRIDLDEVGNVFWLQIALTGFKDRPIGLQYGLYDLNSREALLPGTAKPVELRTPGDDHVTLFFPAWIGYPRSDRFKAEFRLVDRDGVQELVATGPMGGADFRYACERVKTA